MEKNKEIVRWMAPAMRLGVVQALYDLHCYNSDRAMDLLRDADPDLSGRLVVHAEDRARIVPNVCTQTYSDMFIRKEYSASE